MSNHKPGHRWLNDPELRARFQRRLLNWYRLNQRTLPWRANRDPYRVWISEIMLQQTRVATAIPHYQKFLKRFPNAHKLAAAKESSVLAAWSGLGYYRRARMLHAASKKVAQLYGGNLPRSREELRKLPGIGRYTSAAIASIAYQQPAAAVDANIRRVMQRLIGRLCSSEEIWRTAERLLDPKNPGDFNEGLMELGATICLPRQPTCALCPITEHCVTRGALTEITNRVRQRKRTIRYSLNCRNSSVFLVKRSLDTSLMPGMWELPEAPESKGPIEPIFTLRHSITITDLTVQVVTEPISGEYSGKWVKNDRARNLPLTGLARKILRVAGII